MKSKLKPMLLSIALSAIALVSVSSNAASEQHSLELAMQETSVASITRIQLPSDKLAFVVLTSNDSLSLRTIADISDFTPHTNNNKNQFFEMAHKFNDAIQMILSTFKDSSTIKMHEEDLSESHQDDDSINVSSKNIPANCKKSKALS